MANFIPGWNFSPANWADISDRLLKQILWKPNCRLHREGFSPGRNSARAENPCPIFSSLHTNYSFGDCGSPLPTCFDRAIKQNNCPKEEPVCTLGILKKRLGLSARPNGPENRKKCHVIETEFQSGPKKEREHAHWLCFRTSVIFLTEICVLRLGWNWACFSPMGGAKFQLGLKLTM